MHTPLGHKELPLPALDKLDSCEQAVHYESWSSCSQDHHTPFFQSDLLRDMFTLSHLVAMAPVLTEKQWM